MADIPEKFKKYAVLTKILRIWSIMLYMSDETGGNPRMFDETNPRMPTQQEVGRRDVLVGGLGALGGGVIGYISAKIEGGQLKTSEGLQLPNVMAKWTEAQVTGDELSVQIHVDILSQEWETLVYLTTPREHAPDIQRDLKNPIDGSWAILGWGIPDAEGSCHIVANLVQAGSPRGQIPLSFDVWSRHTSGEGKGGIFPTEQPDGLLTVSY